MPCSCTMHFDQRLLDHIEHRRNAEAESMLNENLAEISNCRGTLLHHAAAVGNEEITKHLIDMGSPLDSPGLGAKTPLIIAVERDRTSAVRVLLEAGANIDIVDAKEESALYKALHSTCIDFEIVEAFLLRARAETPMTKKLIERLLAVGCTLPYAVLLRNIGILENFLQRGFDINSKNPDGRTALHYAALIKDSKSAELLVARGADVNAADYREAGPLYYAAEGTDPGMLRLLLDHGANPYPGVRFVDQMPLFACFIVGASGDEELMRECAELLLECGAFPRQPRLFAEQVQLCFNPTFRNSQVSCLVAHQAGLDALGVQSCKDEEHLTTFVELRKYYNECRQMLEVAVIGNMTVLNLLDIHKNGEIRLRARDQKFCLQVEKFCAVLKETFPYYARILSKQVAKAVRVVKLERRGILVVCALFECDFNQLNVFARLVVSYLNEHDLEQLCRVEFSS